MQYSTENDIQSLLVELKSIFNSSETPKSLDIEFESAAKHIPSYLKIVKGHIEQLAKVLKLDNHGNCSLDEIELAEPVKQLITLFKNIDENDVKLLENFAQLANNWSNSKTKDSNNDLEAAELSAMTTIS